MVPWLHHFGLEVRLGRVWQNKTTDHVDHTVGRVWQNKTTDHVAAGKSG
jgi:hypothetical protein